MQCLNVCVCDDESKIIGLELEFELWDSCIVKKLKQTTMSYIYQCKEDIRSFAVIPNT